MPTFDIIKKSDVKDTFRVKMLENDFDVKAEHSVEHFKGEIELPKKWNIGMIVGGSGTGKTTIAKELFGDDLINGFEWTDDAVVDNMPHGKSMSDIERMFFAVGFGSVPSWLKPYNVLSNGEKMRVDLARALLEKDFVVFDEFTSVVDRQVAKVACIAVNKAIKRTDKQFIAVSCHKDIIEWLQPDWVFDTDTMTQSFPSAHDQSRNLRSENVGIQNGKSLAVIII